MGLAKSKINLEKIKAEENSPKPLTRDAAKTYISDMLVQLADMAEASKLVEAASLLREMELTLQ